VEQDLERIDKPRWSLTQVLATGLLVLPFKPYGLKLLFQRHMQWKVRRHLKIYRSFPLGAGVLLMFCGCSELRLPLGNPAPTSPTVNTLPKHYRANPAMSEQPKVYGMVDVSYRLVDWNDLASVRNKYSRKGYVPLGQCDFAAQTGAPRQQNAIDFARYLGANLIVYAIQKTADGDARHYIDFLAKTRKPGVPTPFRWGGDPPNSFYFAGRIE